MKRALIIVDVQFDFLTGGALAVPQGEEVIPVIMEMAADYDRVVGTRDVHPRSTEHFKVWPPHCIRGTAGAGIHPFVRELCQVVVEKGQSTKDDGYSGFDGTTPSGLTLDEVLKGCEQVTVVGLAQDYCVKATAIDAAERGFRTIVPLDATRPVRADTGIWHSQRAVVHMEKAGVTVIP